MVRRRHGDPRGRLGHHGVPQSVGARFLKLDSVTSGAGEGGYARALTADEQSAQQAELTAQIARFDAADRWVMTLTFLLVAVCGIVTAAAKPGPKHHGPFGVLTI